MKRGIITACRVIAVQRLRGLTSSLAVVECPGRRRGEPPHGHARLLACSLLVNYSFRGCISRWTLTFTWSYVSLYICIYDQYQRASVYDSIQRSSSLSHVSLVHSSSVPNIAKTRSTSSNTCRKTSHTTIGTSGLGCTFHCFTIFLFSVFLKKT